MQYLFFIFKHFFSRCFSNEKFYAVDLKLKGFIIPMKTKIVKKTFHVLVTLEKLYCLSWSRLYRDEEKYRWVSADVESLEEKNTFVDAIQMGIYFHFMLLVLRVSSSAFDHLHK